METYRQILQGSGEEATALIRGGDAAKNLLLLPFGRPPRGRPVMTPAVERAWDALQAETRKIEVIVTASPVEEFDFYFCAKRSWPRGATRTVVSPQELAELEQDSDKRIQVIRLSEVGHIVPVAAVLEHLKAKEEAKQLQVKRDAEAMTRVELAKLTEAAEVSDPGGTGTPPAEPQNTPPPLESEAQPKRGPGRPRKAVGPEV